MNPEELKAAQKELCEKLELKGRIIIAHEGINVTLEGTKENIGKYLVEMKKDQRFDDLDVKNSESLGNSFPKLSIKVRDEIVTSHFSKKVDPTKVRGKYIYAEELHNWIESKKEFYIVDMRNDYEHKVGHFEGSILPPIRNFRDLPKVVEDLSHLKDKTVVTVCTGGVRCEKASGFLVTEGFNNVYQLYGGIHTYMEKYPNKDFKGKLYVFDGRVTIGFNTDSEEHEIISECEKCGEKSDNYVDCGYLHCVGKRHFICCKSCVEKGNKFCSEDCIRNEDQRTELITAQRVKNFI